MSIDAVDVSDDVVPPNDPVRDVLEHACFLLRTHGLEAVSQRSVELLGSPPSTPAVAFIGEPNRGKSELINALAGIPELMPVGVGVSTGVPVAICPPTAGLPAGEARIHMADGTTTIVAASELADWVTTTGGKVGGNIERTPVHAEVAIEGSSVPGAVLIDTPGYGALDRNDAAAMQRFARDTGVLVFVCDATAPISRPELDYLRNASADIESVVLVVAKIDANRAHWRTITAENHRLLSVHAPRYADIPVIPVSASQALRAHALSDRDRRRKGMEVSGILQLSDTLNTLVTAAHHLPVINALRIARNGLDLIARDDEQKRGTFASPESASELNRKRKLLAEAERNYRDTKWQDQLVHDFKLLQHSLNAAYDRELETLKTKWETKIDEKRMEFLRGSHQAMLVEIKADFDAAVVAVSTEFAAGVQKILEDRRLKRSGTRDNFEASDLGDKEIRAAGILDPAMIMISSNLAVGTLSALLAGGIGAFLPVLPISLTAVTAVVAFKKISATRKAYKDWIAKTGNDLRKSVLAEIDTAISKVRSEVKHGYRASLERRIKVLRDEIQAAQEAQKASEAERADAIAELDIRVKGIKASAAALDAEIARWRQPSK